MSANRSCQRFPRTVTHTWFPREGLSLAVCRDFGGSETEKLWYPIWEWLGTQSMEANGPANREAPSSLPLWRRADPEETPSGAVHPLLPAVPEVRQEGTERGKRAPGNG